MIAAQRAKNLAARTEPCVVDVAHTVGVGEECQAPNILNAPAADPCCKLVSGRQLACVHINAADPTKGSQWQCK